ncbi:MAG: hypothetical protein LIO93_07800 [Bacteroidales bacterium]|nr:hypothetical protein [Bacteroidales bacterium]
MQTLRSHGNYRTHFLISAKGDKLILLNISTVSYFYIIDGTVYAVNAEQKKIIIPHTIDEAHASLSSVFLLN